MTITPDEPLADPDVVPSGDPVAPGQQPDPDATPNPETDPETSPPEPDVRPL